MSDGWGQESPAFRDALAQQLRPSIPAEQLERALGHQRQRGGLFSTALTSVGVPPEQVRAALATAAGHPAAPVSSLQNPDPTLSPMSSNSGWRQVKAAPFGRAGTLVQIAFANPSVLSSAAAATLPPHQAFVALESEVTEVLGRLGQSGSTLPLPSAPVPRAATATGADLGRFGSYLLERELGAGGMAVVYLAKEATSDRRVALKLMSQQLAKDPHFIARFVQEAKASAALRHPNIVEVFAYGEEQGRPFIASEWVDGPTLERLLETVGPLPVPIALEIFAQLLEAVAYAHERGIIHRDLKPANLLLARAGWAKLADFGIAKTTQSAGLTQTGATLGTPAYMSPEQAAGRAVDGRSDLFSAGVVLYEMVCGVNPHLGPDPMSCLSRLAEPRTPSVQTRAPATPEPVATLIDRLLERDVARRPATAREVLGLLAPMVNPSRERREGLLARFLDQPSKLVSSLHRESATLIGAEARALLDKGVANRRRAAFLLHRACQLAPDDAALRATFAQVLAAERISAAASTSPQVLALEAQLKNEQTPELLHSLAGLYRREANVFRAAELLGLYLTLRPDDLATRTALAVLRGERSQAPATTQSQPAVPDAGEGVGSAARDLLARVGRRRLLYGGAGLLVAWVGYSLWSGRVNRRATALEAARLAQQQERARSQGEAARSAQDEARTTEQEKAAQAATARDQERELKQWLRDTDRAEEIRRREQARQQRDYEREKEREDRERQRARDRGTQHEPSGSPPSGYVPSGGWVP